MAASFRHNIGLLERAGLYTQPPSETDRQTARQTDTHDGIASRGKISVLSLLVTWDGEVSLTR